MTDVMVTVVVSVTVTVDVTVDVHVHSTLQGIMVKIIAREALASIELI